MKVRETKLQPAAKEELPNNIAQRPTAHTVQIRLLSRFDVKEKLGSGSFGHIFKVFDRDRNEMVAIKIESHSHSHNPTLNREAKVIHDLEGSSGIPTLYHYSKEEGYSVMALTLLGSNLEKLFKSCNRNFTVKTVLMLADQMIRRIEYVHSKGYLHRDIKPENFVLGPEKDPKTLYLIDFGLSKMYRDHTGKLNPYKEGRGLVGTARYASISTHLGIEQSRRDDLESIGYLLIYFLKGSLPWQSAKAQNKTERYKQIADCKMNTPVEELCKDLPQEFTTYMTYVRGLSFTDQPDYKFLKKLFRQCLVERGHRFDLEYDWSTTTDKGHFEFMSIQEEVYKYSQEESQKEEKKFEIYENIKQKALEYNLEFKERNINMEFAPPQGHPKGKNQEYEPSSPNKAAEKQSRRLSMSPARMPRTPKLFVTTSKMSPKEETDAEFANIRLRDSVASATLAHTKGSTNDSPLYPRMRRPSRNIMPEKPNFALVCTAAGGSKEDSSSPQLSVNPGSLNDHGSDEFNEQDEKSPCDRPINEYNKDFVVKRLREVKAKTMVYSSFKDAMENFLNQQNDGKLQS